MAERRMFAKTIIDSDAFLDMPTSARLLYFDFGMRADDEGFINSPKKIMRMSGASEDDIKLLIAKNFIIPFESGIVVIKHWRLHNYIQNDRFKETVYRDERKLLQIKDNKVYTKCIQSGHSLDTQVSIDKVSIDKVSIDKVKYIVGHLNSKASTHYKITDKTKALITARINQGFTEQDFIIVIDKKCQEWLGTEMEKYLRPETLFGNKFEGYLNQKITKKKSTMESLQKLYEEAENE